MFIQSNPLIENIKNISKLKVGNIEVISSYDLTLLISNNMLQIKTYVSMVILTYRILNVHMVTELVDTMVLHRRYYSLASPNVIYI